MWTRTYLLLMLVRFYFALSPSYIHPDENFQGPEVIAGMFGGSSCFIFFAFIGLLVVAHAGCESNAIDAACDRRSSNLTFTKSSILGRIFGFPHHLTWEFTSPQPVRSAFVLWPVYGLPMVILRWVRTEPGQERVAPEIIYYALRAVMFILSFVLEDWAIHELIHSRLQRRVALILVASSYVTWTYQTHTFSNSVETLTVLWSLVIIQRILENKHRSSIFASAFLGSLVVFGTFNRITFPAFLILPGLHLLPHFLRKPLSLLALLASTSISTLLAILTDTSFYRPSSALSLTDPPPTPLSSLLYNLSPSNLSLHGTHPFYQHILINLPLLILPAIPLLLAFPLPSLRLFSALSGTAILSLFSHQEGRFLLPCVPLLLSSISLPRNKRWTRVFIGTWIVFNATLGVLMGIYHQGGVIPMQIALGKQQLIPDVKDVLWWKTYSPPIWLLDGKPGDEGLQTTDLMGMPITEMIATLSDKLGTCTDPEDQRRDVIVVAPRSRIDLDEWTRWGKEVDWQWSEEHTVWRHLNLDDLDVSEEGVMGSLRRVVGRRGLTAWRVGRRC